jgi:hypothetical protein
MHTKYTDQQIKDFKHDKKVEEFHEGKLHFKRIKNLTEIGNIFGKKIFHHHKVNQWTNWQYFEKDIDTHAEILTDNWTMTIQAWKNRFAFSEDHKRQERYMIYKYKNKC